MLVGTGVNEGMGEGGKVGRGDGLGELEGMGVGARVGAVVGIGGPMNK